MAQNTSLKDVNGVKGSFFNHTIKTETLLERVSADYVIFKLAKHGISCYSINLYIIGVGLVLLSVCQTSVPLPFSI